MTIIPGTYRSASIYDGNHGPTHLKNDDSKSWYVSYPGSFNSSGNLNSSYAEFIIIKFDQRSSPKGLLLSGRRPQDNNTSDYSNQPSIVEFKIYLELGTSRLNGSSNTFSWLFNNSLSNQSAATQSRFSTSLLSSSALTIKYTPRSLGQLNRNNSYYFYFDFIGEAEYGVINISKIESGGSYVAISKCQFFS
jgi:hypothetical protein